MQRATGNGDAMITTLIVDDEPDVLALLRIIIGTANGGLVVAAEAHDGLEAVELCRSNPPTVAILDHRMPLLTGLEAAVQILHHNPAQPIMMLSAYLEDGELARAAELGVTVMSKRDILDVPDTLRRLAAAS